MLGCCGGGSNLGGIALPFVPDEHVRLVAAEPSSCPTLTEGHFDYDFGDTAGMTPLLPMYTLGHDFVPPPIHAGGLRYHGDSPIISNLVQTGRMEAVAYPQSATFDAAVQFANTEGKLPAPEAGHVIRAVIDEALAAQRRRRGTRAALQLLRPRPPRPLRLRRLPAGPPRRRLSAPRPTAPSPGPIGTVPAQHRRKPMRARARTVSVAVARPGRRTRAPRLLAAAASVACVAALGAPAAPAGALTPAGPGLPPPQEAAIARLFNPQLARLGLHVSRASLEQPPRYTPSATGRHLAVYAVPTGSYSGADYQRNITAVARIFLPLVFKRWRNLESFDVCQEPLPSIDPRPEAPPLTQVFVTRRGAARVDWAHASLADFVAASRGGSHGVILYIDSPLLHAPVYLPGPTTTP